MARLVSVAQLAQKVFKVLLATVARMVPWVPRANK